MDKKTTITELADFVAEMRFEDLPVPVVVETKRLILDSIGCALAAAKSDRGKRGIKFARQFFTGSSQATVIGYGDKMSALGAAFVNGELVNALDYDSNSPLGHTIPFVFPASLAIAEMRQSSGKDLIVACALGYEISERIARGLAHTRNVVDGKATWPAIFGYSCCIFGGTAGVGKLEGFSKDELAHGLGLAGDIAPMQTMGFWMRNPPSTTVKYSMAGWMAQAELTVAYLTKAGHRGNISILDGDYGFWRYAGSSKWDPTAVVKGLGKEWCVPTAVFIKRYPACRISHGAMDCLDAIIQENGLRPEEIDSIHAYLNPYSGEPVSVWRNREIKNEIDAQFSVPYNLSVLVHGIKPRTRWQNQDTMSNPEILRFMEKITFEPHPGFAAALEGDQRSRPAKVVVSARGKTFVKESQYVIGTPSPIKGTYLPDDKLVEKFKENASVVLSIKRAVAVANRVMELDGVADIRQIVELLH